MTMIYHSPQKKHPLSYRLYPRNHLFINTGLHPLLNHHLITITQNLLHPLIINHHPHFPIHYHFYSLLLPLPLPGHY